MDREQRDEQIWLYAIGALESAEAEAVRKWLEAADAQDLATYRDAVEAAAAVALSLPPQSAPTAARERLLKRVRSSDQLFEGTSARRLPWLSWAFTAMAAAAAIALALNINRLSVERQRLLTENERQATELATLRQESELLAARQLALVKLAGGTPESKGFGRVFWNKETSEWHVYVFDMTPPPPGKTFELWFITPDQTKIPAGTFQVDAGGNGNIVVKLPHGLENVALAAITDEPTGGVQQPTGSIQLVGKVE